jgi:hypothetical protein
MSGLVTICPDASMEAIIFTCSMLDVPIAAFISAKTCGLEVAVPTVAFLGDFL